jgi:glycosyltransferase involved in cell wall biosynthesis
MLVNHSDYIITHSHEGIEFVHSLNGNPKKPPVLYIPHPIKPNLIKSNETPKYDLIIWGNIVPYKGIDLFLDYLKKHGLLEKYNILIAGKIADSEYEKKLRNYQSKSISIVNQFIDSKKLKNFIKASNIILFTYREEYVLSSGALTDSVAYGKKVIGPDIGAFRDLKEAGLIYTYKNFSDLTDLIDKLLNQKDPANSATLEKFFKENNWPNYGKTLHNWIVKNNIQT